MSEIEKLFRFARQTAHEAGKLTLDYFNKALRIHTKEDGSPVTVADRLGEESIRKAIESAFPDHGILGEEHGIKEPRNGSEFMWYIDPIDGTKSFIHGVPLYSTLLACVRGDTPIAGIIELPAMGRQLAAAEGLGCFEGDERVSVSKVSSLSEATCLTTDERSLRIEKPDRRWAPLWQDSKLTRGWGDGFGHYLVATGRAEIMLDPKVSDYDIAALPVIMKEAGGHFSDWRGENSFRNEDAFTCNAALADLVLNTLKR